MDSFIAYYSNTSGKSFLNWPIAWPRVGSMCITSFCVLTFLLLVFLYMKSAKIYLTISERIRSPIMCTWSTLASIYKFLWIVNLEKKWVTSVSCPNTKAIPLLFFYCSLIYFMCLASVNQHAELLNLPNWSLGFFHSLIVRIGLWFGQIIHIFLFHQYLSMDCCTECIHHLWWHIVYRPAHQQAFVLWLNKLYWHICQFH